MGFWKRLSVVFVIECFLSFLSCYVTFANHLEYSTVPPCNGNIPTCKNENETAVCLSLEKSKVGIEYIDSQDGKKENKFQVSCDVPDSVFPQCVDITESNQVAPEYVVVECIEIPKCEPVGNDSKLVAICSTNKKAGCRGTSEEPTCVGSEPICESGFAVCDNKNNWQISSYINPTPLSK